MKLEIEVPFHPHAVQAPGRHESCGVTQQGITLRTWNGSRSLLCPPNSCHVGFYAIFHKKTPGFSQLARFFFFFLKKNSAQRMSPQLLKLTGETILNPFGENEKSSLSTSEYVFILSKKKVGQVVGGQTDVEVTIICSTGKQKTPDERHSTVVLGNYFNLVGKNSNIPWSSITGNH